MMEVALAGGDGTTDPGGAVPAGAPSPPPEYPVPATARDAGAQLILAADGALSLAPGAPAAADEGWLLVSMPGRGDSPMLWLRPGDTAHPLHPERAQDIAAALDAAEPALAALETLLGLAIEPGPWVDALPPGAITCGVVGEASAGGVTGPLHCGWLADGVVARRVAERATLIAARDGREALRRLGTARVTVDVTVDVAAIDTVTAADLTVGDWIIWRDAPCPARVDAPLTGSIRHGTWQDGVLSDDDEASLLSADADAADPMLAVSARWEAAVVAADLASAAPLSLPCPPDGATVAVLVAGRAIGTARMLRIGQRAGLDVSTVDGAIP